MADVNGPQHLAQLLNRVNRRLRLDAVPPAGFTELSVAQVRVLSAEGRMSAWVLGLLPFGVMIMMKITNPAYLSVLWTDPVGVQMMWYGSGMMVAGVLWLRKLIHIRI